MPGSDDRAGRPTNELAIVEGEALAGGFVFVCEHASNYIPPQLRGLGLAPADLEAHIAWDIGALALARGIAARLGGVLLRAGVSRLVVDLNRSETAPDVIPEVSETTAVPGNAGLDTAARAERLATFHTPFHRRLAALLDARAEAGLVTRLVSVHSFTPVYKGRERPWQVGMIHDAAAGLALRILAGLQREPGIHSGENVPYSPADRVYHTLATHGDARGLETAMIEVRNDELRTRQGIEKWVALLARSIAEASENGEARREAI